VLDRPLVFDDEEVNFAGVPTFHHAGDGSGPLPSRKSQSNYPGRWPL